MDGAELARRIDYAFLKVTPSTRVEDLRRAVESTEEYDFRAICVPPVLAGTVKKNFPRIKVAAVIAYPLGLESLAAKLFAVQEVIEQAVDELDIVLDLFALVNNNHAKIEREAEQLGELASRAGVFVKAIIETPILDVEQIRWAAEVLAASPIACVKTSTGYGREPTSLDQVRLLKQLVGGRMQIKAAGGIKNLYDARTMLDAGADIIGTSNAISIINEVRATSTS